MPFYLIRKDITAVKADAIVNTANTEPIIGGGVDYAIYQKAGHKLLQERKKIGKISVGEARITPAFDLPVRKIIHTVSPYADEADSVSLLKRCYRNTLNLAVENKLESIAFPLIGAGTCGFVSQTALEIATEEIKAFLENNEMDIYLTVLDKTSFKISTALYDEVKSYIDDVEAEEMLREYHYKDYGVARAATEQVDNLEIPSWVRRLEQRERRREEERLCQEAERKIEEERLCREAERRLEERRRSENESCEYVPELDLCYGVPADWAEIIKQEEEGFSEYLLKKIDESGRTDADVYKKANLDRKLFSKIRNDKNYKPKKYTALALAISLQMDKEEALNLIGKAGYTLTRSSRGDLIIEYCLTHKKYNIYEINEILYEYNQPLLGSSKI